MIRMINWKLIAEGMIYAELAGYSGDDKPDEGLVTGSRFLEADTGIEYVFEEEAGAWIPMNSGNGKTSITGATVTLGSDLVYTGNEQTKAVSSVKLGDTTLTADTDYDVVGNKGTDVGSYTLRIVGKSSYTGIIPKDWTIGKGSGSVSASPDTLTLTEGGEAGESELMVTGDGAVTVASSAKAGATAELNDDTVTVTPLTVGTATVTVTLAAGDRYTGDTATISVTVEAEESDDEES